MGLYCKCGCPRNRGQSVLWIGNRAHTAENMALMPRVSNGMQWWWLPNKATLGEPRNWIRCLERLHPRRSRAPISGTATFSLQLQHDYSVVQPDESDDRLFAELQQAHRCWGGVGKFMQWRDGASTQAEQVHHHAVEAGTGGGGGDPGSPTLLHGAARTVTWLFRED